MKECVTHYYGCDCREAAYTKASKERDALAARVKELDAQLGKTFEQWTTDVKYRMELESQCAAQRNALIEICDRKRLRDLSKLASNPPQNGAIRDVLLIAEQALFSSAGSALLDRLRKAEAVVEAAKIVKAHFEKFGTARLDVNDVCALIAVSKALDAFDSEKGTK